MRSLNILISDIVKNILDKQHPYLSNISKNWYELIGTEFFDKTLPLKIKSKKVAGQSINILYIQVCNPAISMQLYFHQETILERITMCLGFQAIHKIKFLIFSDINDIKTIC